MVKQFGHLCKVESGLGPLAPQGLGRALLGGCHGGLSLRDVVGDSSDMTGQDPWSFTVSGDTACHLENPLANHLGPGKKGQFYQNNINYDQALMDKETSSVIR